MKFTVDTPFLMNRLEELINTPSPVGYYVELNPLLERYAAEFGLTVTYDHRSTAYMTLEGEDHSKTVLIGAHGDTLGLMVRRIEADGTIRVRNLGGVNFCNLEGESVTIHTRNGGSYTGLICCQSHSVHAFEDARTLERNENTMMILLDEPVHSEQEVKALGIRHGDFVSIEPRFQVTQNGYVKSRFLDDKAAIACCFAMVKYLKDHDLKPKYRTILAVPYHEEIGLGGTFVPPEVSEYVAVDIGLIGPDYDGNEYSVSICAKDNIAPYDYELTNRLISYAEKAECDYAVDIYFHYGTDANVAMRGGNNLRAATFGMAVYCSHGMERTHTKGLEATTNLLLAYVLDI